MCQNVQLINQQIANRKSANLCMLLACHHCHVMDNGRLKTVAGSADMQLMLYFAFCLAQVSEAAGV